MEAEFSSPDWTFGQSTYAFVGDRLVASWIDRGTEHLGIIEGGHARKLDLPFTVYGSVVAWGTRVVTQAGSSTAPGAIVAIDVDSGDLEVIRRSSEVSVDPRYLSKPQPISFPTTDGATTHALWYPPRNGDYEGPEGERPPLLVHAHGGPTSQTSAAFNLHVNYWTSRGFGLVDVDYRGSSGYGRAYRQALYGNWGVADVDDCVRAAAWLADRGEVDRERMAIIGASAGGYLALAALAFRDVFAAGVTAFGVSDVEALRRDTHKLESHYVDQLIGPWPEAAEIDHERSPIHHLEGFSCPLLVFQGMDDTAVPPAQSEMIVEALRMKGVPVAYLAFEGEGHGFRKRENNLKLIEGQLYFYGRVFGFQPADEIEPIPIENQEKLPS
jgi:dipeptidyl aminopeptidase/acylaminoacyl peptidase